MVPCLHSAGASIGGLLAVVGMMATTFSIAGAFYQAYLVRDKGWKLGEVKRGLVDSVVRISILGLIALVIMLTAAATFHGKVEVANLATVTDVAKRWRVCSGRGLQSSL